MKAWLLCVPLLAACQPKGQDGWFVLLYGDVVDEGGAPLAGATLRFVTLDGAEVGESTTDADGRWTLPVFGTELVGNRLSAAIDAEGYAEGVATWQVDLRAPVTTLIETGPWETWQITDRRLATVRLAAEVDAATVEGVVVDAVTGLPVAGVPLALQLGADAPVDAPAAHQTTTDADGRFAFTAYPAGAYTVYATPSDPSLAPARFPAFLTGAGGSAIGVVSAPVEAGLLRASLTWGEGVADADLHLSAPRADGTAGGDGNGQYHVWAGRPTHPETDPEGVGPEAAIERTDADGVGPETVAIYRPPGLGSIFLSAFDNDHEADGSATALADAGAVLQVWYGEDDPRFYVVDPGEPATLWNPVELDTESGVAYAVPTYRSGDAADDPDAFFQP